MNADDHDLITDRNLDRLLAASSNPGPPLGAQSRLLQRIASESLTGRHQPSAWRWIMAAPLAASLAIGVYLGSAGYGSGVLFADDVAYADDFDTGIEEAESVAEEDQS